MAAGFTVLFGAPLGSALFALEILHRRGLQYYEALIPAVAGSLCGYTVYVALSGLSIAPVWEFPPVGTLHTWHLGLAVGARRDRRARLHGVRSDDESAETRLRTSATTCSLCRRRIALGLLGFWSPYALTFGETQLSGLLDNRLAASALVIAVLAKLAGTTVTLAAGWKGGFIIPLFFMGAVTGQLIHVGFPNIDQSMLMACLMVAMCVGVTKTPLGTTLVVTEMAGLTLLPVTLIAAVVSMVVTRSLNVIETQRSRIDEAET